MIFEILFFILSFIMLTCGLYSYINANNIKVDKDIEQSEINKNKEKLEEIQNEYNKLCNSKANLILDIENEKKHFEELQEKEIEKLSKSLKLFETSISFAQSNYINTLEQKYNEVEQEYDDKMNILLEEQQNCEEELEKLRASLNAGVQASLREREKEENLQFYKLHLTDKELDDVIKLDSIKLSLHQPIILSKLIWSTYFQKQTTEMCNRILTNKKICGIYKITNIKTKQCYVGQSVDVAQRWKDHVKCGLGIEAPATNKLYNSMQQDGVWSFTFELMEECPREQLNEKEKLWIELYQANIYGYNANKGVG